MTYVGNHSEEKRLYNDIIAYIEDNDVEKLKDCTYRQYIQIVRENKGRFIFAKAAATYNKNIMAVIIEYFVPVASGYTFSTNYWPLSIINKQEHQFEIMEMMHNMNAKHSSMGSRYHSDMGSFTTFKLCVIKVCTNELILWYITKYNFDIGVPFVRNVLSSNYELLINILIKKKDLYSAPEIIDILFENLNKVYARTILNAIFEKVIMYSNNHVLLMKYFLKKMKEATHDTSMKKYMMQKLFWRMYTIDAVNLKFLVKTIDDFVDINDPETYKLLGIDYFEQLSQGMNFMLRHAIKYFDEKSIKTCFAIMKYYKINLDKITVDWIQFNTNKQFELLKISIQCGFYNLCFHSNLTKETMREIKAVQREQLAMPELSEHIAIKGVRKIILNYVGFL